MGKWIVNEEWPGEYEKEGDGDVESGQVGQLRLGSSLSHYFFTFHFSLFTCWPHTFCHTQASLPPVHWHQLGSFFGPGLPS